MAYTKNTNFTAKDALASGNPSKLVKGTELDAEFDEIATESAKAAELTANNTLSGNNTFSGISTFSGTIAGASPLIFEGATADAFETTLAVTDPTADRTITVPDATGTLVLADAANTFSAAQTFTSTVDLSGSVLQGASPLVMEGATADGFETTVAVTDPTADRTITLPDETGTVTTSGTASVSGASWVLDEDTMTSDSATQVPTQQSVKAYVDTQVSAGQWELISTTSVTAASTVDITFDETTYVAVRFEVEGVIPATDDQDLRFRLLYSNGASVETGSVYHDGAKAYHRLAGASEDAGNGVGTAASESASGTVELVGYNTAHSGCFITSKFVYTDFNNAPEGTQYNQNVNFERSYDGGRFYWTTGNFEASGTIYLYGLKRT